MELSDALDERTNVAEEKTLFANFWQARKQQLRENHKRVFSLDTVKEIVANSTSGVVAFEIPRFLLNSLISLSCAGQRRCS
jgi:hypothetical protein